jgi:hypothetical protein
MTNNVHRTKDPLLALATGVIWFILGITVFAGIIVAICIPGVLLVGAEFVDAPALNPLSAETQAVICALLVGVAGVLYLLWRFFRSMLAIVQSVSQGDPFIPENADRLTAMGWTMLAINIAAIPLAMLGAYVGQLVGENKVSTEFGIDFGGIVLILTLFILARVFRHGAAMRDDLEGTV